MKWFLLLRWTLVGVVYVLGNSRIIAGTTSTSTGPRATSTPPGTTSTAPDTTSTAPDTTSTAPDTTSTAPVTTTTTMPVTTSTTLATTTAAPSILEETILHLKKDLSRFILLHKVIMDFTRDGAGSQVVVVIIGANRVWELLDDLNNLICYFVMKNEDIIEGKLKLDDPFILEVLKNCTAEILRITADLFDAIRDIRTANEQANNIVDPSIIDEFEKLITTCLEASQDLLIKVLLELNLFFLRDELPEANLKGPFSEIFLKQRDLKVLCHRLQVCYQEIRRELMLAFGDVNTMVKYPSRLMYDFFKCICELCRLAYDLRLRKPWQVDIYGKFSIEIEKFICGWITRALIVREKLRDSLDTLPTDVVESFKVLPRKIVQPDGRIVKRGRLTRNIIVFLNLKIDGIFATFDVCVFHIRCLYVTIVTARLPGGNVG